METLQHSQRLVVKVGSSLIAKPESGRPNLHWMAGLAKDVAALRGAGKEVCIVSSGAVALGRTVLGIPHGTLAQPEKQAAAACGQMLLMQAWQEVFADSNIHVAQVLLTLDDSDSRRRYLNARGTLNTLLARGIIPIINENDTVATRELRVGDNDRLAARAAQMIGADALVLLSDIDGLYTADPSKDASATFIPVVQEIDARIRSYAAPPVTMVGTGGMVTKVEAAVIATASGCHTIIARGTEHQPLSALQQGGKHTVFVAHTTPMSARKEWIAGSLSPAGVLSVDKGAEDALLSCKSLLPVGVVEISGSFQRGDAVLIQSKSSGKALAKGLVCYNSEELVQIMGKHSQHIPSILGYDRGDVAVHRDDMVMV
jgi:glutamate 5-kinase